jgi:hypothetical protein
MSHEEIFPALCRSFYLQLVEEVNDTPSKWMRNRRLAK